jgi:hypothetical protein
VGQPTWIGKNQIVVKTVLRSDIHIGDFLTLPPNTLMTMTGDAAGLSGQQSGKLTFQGSFIVNRVLHVGESRNPDGSAWVTNFYCTTNAAADGQNDAATNTANSNVNQNAGSGAGVTTPNNSAGDAPTVT